MLGSIGRNDAHMLYNNNYLDIPYKKKNCVTQ